MKDWAHVIMFLFIVFTTIIGQLTYAIMLLLVIIYMQLVVIEKKIK